MRFVSILFVFIQIMSSCPALAETNELPANWNLTEIANAAPPYGEDPKKSKVYTLAWTSLQDDRPFRVDGCLVMKVLYTANGKERWCLAHLCRNEVDMKWRVSAVHVSKRLPPTGLWIQRLKHLEKAPDNRSVYASLADVGWSFKVERGWHVVSCGVCERNWYAALGEKPTQFFDQNH